MKHSLEIWINFKVIGVYTDPGGDREESSIYIPISAAQIAFNAGDNIRDMTFTVGMSKNLDEALRISNGLVQAIENDIKQKYIEDHFFVSSEYNFLILRNIVTFPMCFK